MHIILTVSPKAPVVLATTKAFCSSLRVVAGHQMMPVATLECPSNCESDMSQSGSLSKLRDLTLGTAGEQLKQEMAVEMPMTCEDGDEDSSQFSMSPREHFDHESELCMRYFESWTQTRQTEFVEQLVARMSFHQHEHIYSILMPMLQRDFITALPGGCSPPLPPLSHSHSHMYA